MINNRFNVVFILTFVKNFLIHLVIHSTFIKVECRYEEQTKNFIKIKIDKYEN